MGTRVRGSTVLATSIAALVAVGCGSTPGQGKGESTQTALSGPYSGQRAIGQSTVEPAIDEADGSTIFLLTPDNVPFPSKANTRATAPLYMPVYPTSSTLDPATLDCQPHNCDHVAVLPFPARGYTNGGATCTQYGLPANACALVIGHDHMIGVPPTGDFNVAWAVVLAIFTPQGIEDGAADERIMTEARLDELKTKGDLVEAPTPITFNCSRVSETVYLKGTPLSF